MDILHEFYIQWSIKEAYTKALGFGMNIDFQSFETEIDLSSASCIFTTATTMNESGIIVTTDTINHHNT